MAAVYKHQSGGEAGHAGAIAIANSQLISSGTVVNSIEIAEALVAAGLPAELWVARAGGLLEERVPPGVPIVVLPSCAGRFAALGLASMIAKRKPAVLLSGGKHFHLHARLGLALSRRRRRTAFGGRASNSPERPGRGALANKVARFFYAHKYRGMDFVIAVSKRLADELHVLSGTAADRVRYIPNGVDVRRVRALAAAGVPHRWAGDPARKLIVTLGRVDAQKGVDVLLRALALTRDSRLRLVIIGPGKSDYIAEMRALAARLGIAERIDFAGYSSNPFATIAASDLFVLASRWEGASNALLEALALGVPLVATDCPTGNAEILRGGMLGRLVAVDDAEGLAEAMLAELQTRRDPAARERALASLDLTAGREAYVTTLREWRQRALADESGSIWTRAPL